MRARRTGSKRVAHRERRGECRRLKPITPDREAQKKSGMGRGHPLFTTSESGKSYESFRRI